VYTFQLKQKNWLGILPVFHILVALVFLYDLLHINEHARKDWIFSSVYIIAGVFLLVAGIFNKKLFPNLSRHLALFLFESVLIISGAVYFWSKGASLVAVSHGILAGAVLLLWIYLKKRENGERIVISEKSITLPGLSGDRIVEWYQLSNLVKKDDLLTLDFKNNKLLQVHVINADHIDEDEFNRFCQEQLTVPNN
jgi:hypothetical protein